MELIYRLILSRAGDKTLHHVFWQRNKLLSVLYSKLFKILPISVTLNHQWWVSPVPSDTAGMPLPGPLTPGDHNVDYDDYYYDYYYYYHDHQRQCQALRREFM